MVKTIKALIFLTSLTLFGHAGESITFKQLTELAAKDIGKTVYLDKDIKDYSVDLNLNDYQRSGEIFEFYKIVLFENNLNLQYDYKNDFYFIKDGAAKAVAPDPVHYSMKLHYYTYRIQNITNEDVVKAMQIFKGVSYQHLVQSDMIAYSSTLEQHEQISRVLRASDNEVLHKSIKITLFTINKKKLLSFGSSIKAFDYSFDGTFDGIIQAFRSGGSSKFSLDDSFNMGFTLHALKGHQIADIFQQPTMRLTNGVKSSVSSVLTVPYLKTTSTVDSTTNSIVEQYDYKDIGLQINVSPKIKNDWIYLDLSLVSEELISLEDDKPITQSIKYKNTVRISAGEPILLTGIKKTTKHVDKDGIPILSDIPFLGHLFKQTSNKNDESSMNILIEII